MTDYLPYATFMAIIVCLFFITRQRPFAPSIADNHTIPDKKALEIAVAIAEERPAVFHGGCTACLWRHMNTTHEGIAFCRGCVYFAWNKALPDKSISEYSLEKYSA